MYFIIFLYRFVASMNTFSRCLWAEETNKLFLWKIKILWTCHNYYYSPFILANHLLTGSNFCVTCNHVLLHHMKSLSHTSRVKQLGHCFVKKIPQFECWGRTGFGGGKLRQSETSIFSLIFARANTRPDVPREFYPRRSAKSTHSPHLPDMRQSREGGEKTRENPADWRCGFGARFCVRNRAVFWWRHNFSSRRRERNGQQ